MNSKSPSTVTLLFASFRFALNHGCENGNGAYLKAASLNEGSVLGECHRGADASLGRPKIGDGLCARAANEDVDIKLIAMSQRPRLVGHSGQFGEQIIRIN